MQSLNEEIDTIPLRVTRGKRWLDKHAPGQLMGLRPWKRRVKIDCLFMRKPQYSLLGQLFGFRDDGTPMLPQAANDPTFHFVGMGFMVPPMIERVYGEQGAKRYRYRLMLEWRKATKE